MLYDIDLHLPPKSTKVMGKYTIHGSYGTPPKKGLLLVVFSSYFFELRPRRPNGFSVLPFQVDLGAAGRDVHDDPVEGQCSMIPMDSMHNLSNWLVDLDMF